MIKTYTKKFAILVLTVITLVSCDLERLESAQETADGGGTVETFTAYTIYSTDPFSSNVYGRIVFWKTDLNQTLVQISLYNTIDGIFHPAILVDGAAGMGTNTMMVLDDVDGSTGELASNKFLLIPDTSFYDSITTLDAHVSISLSDSDPSIVADGGGLGKYQHPGAQFHIT